ncbi:hypothetical protein [Nocardia gipuzkoensis]|nr:hypothetical protein [Nocardia gipuzkoensis]
MSGEQFGGGLVGSVAAGELAGADLAEFEKWEVQADEPYEG